MNKLVVIGLDGLTWDTIKPMVSDGELPFFEKLLNEGCSGNLKSCYPPVTPPAWTSIVTGKNPCKHGIYDFQKIDLKNKKASLNLSTDKKTNEIWDYLSANGLKSIVINLPITYPPKKINGVIISGMETPGIDSEFVEPGFLKSEIMNKFPDYKFELDWIFYRGRLNKFKEDIRDLTVQRREVFEYFLEKDCNLFFGVFIEPDRAQHILLDDDLKDYFKFLDIELEKLISKIDKNLNIIFVSDHGLNKVTKKIYLNKLLEEEGFLTFKQNKRKKYSFVKRIGAFFDYLSGLEIIQQIVERFPTKFMGKISKPFLEEDILISIEWENTKAFAFGSGLIYLNDSNLSKDNRKAITSEIRTRLLNLKDPSTGEPVIEEVVHKEEAYNCQLLGTTPDLIVVPRKGYTLATQINEKTLGKTGFKKGDHTMYGIFSAFGPDIEEGLDLGNLYLYDVAPTILHMMDVPIPGDMDGRVLKEMFRGDSEYSKKQIEYQKENGKQMLRSKIREIKVMLK